jgi:hypothetical protein
MKLDYRPHAAPVEQQTEQPTTPQYGFYSPKESDKYTMFVNMQQTVNAALQKNAEVQKPNAKDPTEMPAAQAGIRYEV